MRAAVIAAHLANTLLGRMVVLAVASTSSTLARVAIILTMTLLVAVRAEMVLGVVFEAVTPLAGLGMAVRLQMSAPPALLARVVTESVANFTTLADPGSAPLLQMPGLMAALALVLVVQMSGLSAQSAELLSTEVARVTDALALAADVFLVRMTTLLADATGWSLWATEGVVSLAAVAAGWCLGAVM